MIDIFDQTDYKPTLSRKRDRVYAGLIDLGMIAIVMLAVVFSFGTRVQTFDGSVVYQLDGPLNYLGPALWILIVPVLEGITGQTLGKMLLGIKVVSLDYGKISPGQAIVRHLLDLVDWAPGFGLIGLLVASNNPLSRRVGDLVAKTIVIKTTKRIQTQF